MYPCYSRRGCSMLTARCSIRRRPVPVPFWDEDPQGDSDRDLHQRELHQESRYRQWRWIGWLRRSHWMDPPLRCSDPFNELWRPTHLLELDVSAASAHARQLAPSGTTGITHAQPECHTHSVTHTASALGISACTPESFTHHPPYPTRQSRICGHQDPCELKHLLFLLCVTLCPSLPATCPASTCLDAALQTTLQTAPCAWVVPCMCR